MSTKVEPPLAARGVLFDGSGDDAKKPLKKSLDKQKVFAAVRAAVGDIGAEALAAMKAEIVRQADEMLSAPVVDTIVAAWRTYDQLVDAARATVADAGKTELVDLSSTQITATHTWTVDVTVGVAHISIDFTLTVVFDVHAAVATVRGGSVTSIGNGRCDIHATFTALRQVLADRHQRVDLNHHLTLDPGIVLARPLPPAPPGEAHIRTGPAVRSPTGRN